MSNVQFVEIDLFGEEAIQGKVLVVSNEDEPVAVGRITGFFITDSGQHIPNIKTDEGIEFITFGVILPHDQAFKNLLDSLDYKKRFELLQRMFRMRRVLDGLFYNWKV